MTKWPKQATATKAPHRRNARHALRECSTGNNHRD